MCAGKPDLNENHVSQCF